MRRKNSVLKYFSFGKIVGRYWFNHDSLDMRVVACSAVLMPIVLEHRKGSPRMSLKSS